MHYFQVKGGGKKFRLQEGHQKLLASANKDPAPRTEIVSVPLLYLPSNDFMSWGGGNFKGPRGSDRIYVLRGIDLRSRRRKFRSGPLPQNPLK